VFEANMMDFRYAIRTLLKARGFTLAAVLTLALGVGAATSIFTVVNAVLLRPLPYPDAPQLTMVWLANPLQGIDKDVSPYPTFTAFRDGAASFEHVAAYSESSTNLTGAGEPLRVRGALVSEGFFPLLGVTPMLGRGLRDDEHQPGRHEIVVIGHGLWTRAFGASPAAVGRTVTLNSTPFTIVGIMPPGFAFPRDAEYWVPLAPAGGLRRTLESRGSFWLNVLGRLRDGVSLQTARAELETTLRQLDRQFPGVYDGQGVVLEPLIESIAGRLRTPLLVLQGAVLFLLLIACANVANLLFARAAARQREMAIRAALGAGRARLVRQLLIESVLLAFCGAAGGLVLALWGVNLLQVFGPEDLPRLQEVRVDRTVLAFEAIVMLAATVIFGLAPALQLGRPDLVTPLKDAARDSGSQSGSARALLVGAQIALALMLLIGAGLLFRSFSRVMSVDPGFDPVGVLTVELALPSQRYPESEHRAAFYRRLLERVSTQPGVDAAGAIRDVLLSRLPSSAPIAVEGRANVSEADRNLPIAFDPVTPDFFSATRIPLVAGRGFTFADDDNAPPVAIVNQSLVRRFFPGLDPIGHRVTFDNPDGQNVRWITIVGVAADARRSGLDVGPRPELYLPHAQYSTADMTLILRTTGDPLSLAGSVRAAVEELDPELPLARIATLDRLIGASVAERRFHMLLLAVFSALALVLAAIGIYGVIAFVVSRRTREFGVRLALGAQRADLLRMVLGQGARVIVAGTALGITGALALTRVLEGLLYETSPTDAPTFLGVTATLVGVALVACYIPARRATRIDPVVSLRAE
jgi:putative ABC transport system permease protein